MINPKFKFMSKVKIVDHSFLADSYGTVIGYDPHYASYQVRFPGGIVKEVHEQYLRLVAKRGKK